MDSIYRNTHLHDVPVFTEVLVCVICHLRTVGSELRANSITPKSPSTAAAKTSVGYIHETHLEFECQTFTTPSAAEGVHENQQHGLTGSLGC